ncbi:hypothetical protein V495_01792 [Pseudogymnoascus sp. VKM F-4514 (FW-929)]|nr:hypothetical protein V495_01792 [Pseudogymnoascus sp. VKM F-4514 (FW-929)]KFY57961.1 hypothetical protein V497_05138 [Pseudogymnoascus sp. VKM F-4516 (FW-969)]
MDALSAQKGFDDTMLRLRFELNRAHKLSQILESTVNSGENISPASPDLSYRDLRNTLRDIGGELDHLVDSQSQNRSSHRTMRMARSVKYRFKKKEINKTIRRIGQLIDSLYLTHSSIKLESLHPEIEKLRNDVHKMNVSADERFRHQTETLRRKGSRSPVARRTTSNVTWRRSFQIDQRSVDAVTERSLIGDIWADDILCRLYTTSIEGFERIKKILNSTEIAGLIERLQVWGTGLFEGPDSPWLDELIGDVNDPCIYLLTGCFARICLNIQIIGITLESQDESDLLYLKELSLLLKGGDERVTIPTTTLAEIDSDVNMTAEEKLLKYFDNIEDDLDLLYEMLPAIYIARQLEYLPRDTVQRRRIIRMPYGDGSLYQGAEDMETNSEEDWDSRGEDIESLIGEEIEIEEGAVDERTLLRLVDEDIELANTLAKSLRIQGKEQPSKFEKSPMEATAKLFEAEIEALGRWRTERGERITKEMASILRRQTEGFRATDNVALNKMDAKDMRELLESFQNNNKLLQQLSTDKEKSAKDSKKGPGFKATEAPSRLERSTTMSKVDYGSRPYIVQRRPKFGRVEDLEPDLIICTPLKHGPAAEFPTLPGEYVRNPNLGKPYTESSPPPSRSPREGSLRERRPSYIV